jgi:hypothetical protein
VIARVASLDPVESATSEIKNVTVPDGRGSGPKLLGLRAFVPTGFTTGEVRALLLARAGDP